MSSGCDLSDMNMDALAWLVLRGTNEGGGEGRRAGNHSSAGNHHGHFNSSKGGIGTFGGFNSGGARFDNSTKGFQILGAIEFQASKSIRTSTIILAAFNIIAAFATAAAILYDCYASTRRSNPKYSIRRSGLAFVNSAEVYPLVLSCGIVIQGIIFASAQSNGLEQLLTRGCTEIAEYLLPGIFLVSLIQLIFGFETTFRGLRSRAFQPRGKWDVPVCLGVVAALLLATFLIAFFVPTPDVCFASLFWMVARYSTGCFGFFLFVTVFLAKYAIIIFIRLRRSHRIEATERVAASRLIYYMAFGVVSNGLLIPFFFSLAFNTLSFNSDNQATITLSMVNSVVANVSGLMTGGLHLFLRSSKFSVVHAKDKSDLDENKKAKYRIRVQGPGELSFDEGSSIGSPALLELRRMKSDSTLKTTEKDEEIMLESPIKLVAPAYSPATRPNMVRSPSTYSPTSMANPGPLQMNPSQGPSQGPTQTSQHLRRRSYSLFPGTAPKTASVVPLLPPTTYSPATYHQPANRQQRSNTVDTATTLKPPPALRDGNGKHRRNSSVTSSATVQMVLRLSNTGEMPPIDAKMLQDIKTHDLECPKEGGKRSEAGRPLPLNATTSKAGEGVPAGAANPHAPAVSSPLMKSLPAVPGSVQQLIRSPSAASPGRATPPRTGETLSPNVYDPQSPDRTKLPSPRGVGMTPAAAAGSVGRARSSSAATPGSARFPTSPPRRPTADGSPRRPAAGATGSKGQWI